MHSRSLRRLLTSVLSLSAFCSALPYDQPSKNATSSHIETYYSVDGPTHAQKSKTLTADGYRIISLSTYGSPDKAKYAAIWVQEEGPSFETIYDADETKYNAWLETWKTKGYVSTQVSATGPAGNAVFAGVVEKANVTNWVQSCDLKNPWSFSNMTGSLSVVVKGFRMYGTSSDRRYCILAHENIGNEQTSIQYTTPGFPIDFASTFEAETTKRFWRPSRLYLSEDQIITPSFVDTSVGKWSHAIELTKTELDEKIKTEGEKGLHPIDIQGGGSGSNERFTAVFAALASPKPRHWNVRGEVTGFDDNAAAGKGLDSVMRSFMEKNGVRQAQVAVAIEGKTIAERSYTWAEDDRAIVEPDDKFLLASVSKIFVHAAIDWLVGHDMLNFSTPVYDFLGYKPTDARANDITIQHLLDHAAGYDRSMSGDPGFMFREIALSLPTKGAKAATLRDVIEYMVARPLDFTPGDYQAYSNYGPMLLSYVVTNITGLPYLEFLEKNIWDGLDVKLYETAASKHADDRIVQESKYTGQDPVHPQSAKLVPGPHGGDGAVKEECAGTFALAASASCLAKFIGSHAVWGTGARVSSSRDGSLAGARVFVESRGTIDWAVTLNTREYLSEDEFNDLTWSSMSNFFYDFPIKG
ncbi:beta-lactamase [Fusarium albosuccineum]|uniref:Beta-lactamase n=1 Tax=Fusarium albosuccineum TaxID=1237068 RepID=A0A8H4LJZ4_9HYPO|nr:beta-lactamase [Fusarium albosuccineum]